MRFFIIGCGDVGKFIAYNFDQFDTSNLEIAGFLDDDKSKWGKSFCGYTVLGEVNLLNEQKDNVGAIISVAQPLVKKKIFQKITSKNISYPSLIAKNVWLSTKVTVGKGVIIYPGTAINYHTDVGDFAIINMNCAIGHDCKISSFSTLAPGVSLGGFTCIEECVDMGINSATKQSTRIGKNSTIGGMSMVIKDIPENVTAVGVPAKIIKTKEQ